MLVVEGGWWLDVGGESTRPGAAAVTEAEEMDRVLTAVELLVERFEVIVSVDTSTPKLMTECARLGAGFLNDIRAFRRPGALEAAAETGLPLCVMHMQGEPCSMQLSPEYLDVIADVRHFLEERVAACIQAGIKEERIVLDPGFGFGKSLEHNYQLLAHFALFAEHGYPVFSNPCHPGIDPHLHTPKH